MAAGSDRPLSEMSEDELRAYLPQTETAQFVFGWNLRIRGTGKLTAFDAALEAVAEEPERGDALGDVLREVQAERVRQAVKHGDQSHLPDGTGPDAILLELPAYQHCADADDLARWAKARTQAASQNEGGDGSITFEHILTEEWAEAIAERDPAKLRAELIQVAAVAVQWIQAIDRRMTSSGSADS